MAKHKNKKAAARRSGKRGPSRRSRSTVNGKFPKDALTLVVILRAREGQSMLLGAELQALVGPTRREEGCLKFELHRSVDGLEAYLLHEVWASREAHEEHRRTPHFLRWNARKDALLASRDGTFWKLIA